MPAYASRADVKARAGRVRDAWGAQTAPGDSELDVLLDNVAGLIDVAIASHGFAVPVESEVAQRALLGINADGALVLALAGTFPSGQARAGVSDLLADAQRRFYKSMDMLTDGTHAVIVALNAESASSGVSTARDFWTAEPTYDPWLSEQGLPIGHRPAFHKGQRL